MKQVEGGRSAGYTIVETMIFLAVTAAMFLSAMAMVSGRQNRTQFSTSIRNFEARMNDIASNVATGYYASGDADSGRIRCTVAGSGTLSYPLVTTAPIAGNQRGENKGCTFIGQAIQFAPQGSDYEKYSVIGLVGLQNDPLTGDNVASLAAAHSRALTGYAETFGLEGGARIGCVLYAVSASPGTVPSPSNPCNTPNMDKTDLVAFTSRFSEINYDGKQTGTNKVDVRVRTGVMTPLDRSTPVAATNLENLSDAPGVSPLASSGVYLCLQGTGVNQYALVKFGGVTSQTNVSSEVKDGSCG